MGIFQHLPIKYVGDSHPYHRKNRGVDRPFGTYETHHLPKLLQSNGSCNGHTVIDDLRYLASRGEVDDMEDFWWKSEAGCKNI